MTTLLVTALTYVFYRALVQWRLYQKSFKVLFQDFTRNNDLMAIGLGRELHPVFERFLEDVEPSLRAFAAVGIDYGSW